MLLPQQGLAKAQHAHVWALCKISKKTTMGETLTSFWPCASTEQSQLSSQQQQQVALFDVPSYAAAQGSTPDHLLMDQTHMIASCTPKFHTCCPRLLQC